MIDAGAAGQAWTMLQGLPEDCYPCVVARARVAAALGRRAEAEKLFAQAKRLGPSLPQADEARGRMLLAAGDANGALRAFQQSISTETRFADAHEGAGEAYAALRDWSAAAREYGSAAKLAPQWGKLHIRWAAALWNSGQSDQARSKLVAASRMELSGADRGLLSHLQAVARS
jgi:tetratricopeptide (TPR) repeat protein